MDFGYITSPLLGQVDFSLPPDSEGTLAVLAGAPPTSEKTKVFIGCPTWGRKEWLGKIYPAGAKEGSFLDYYVRQFNTVELNATHYKIYSPSEIRLTITWGPYSYSLVSTLLRLRGAHCSIF